MIRWLMHRAVARMERRFNYDASYLHETLDVSLPAFRRFTRMQAAGGTWRGPAPRDPWCAAAIAGALVEDCGPCVQITADMARAAGMPDAIIRALLMGERTDEDAQLGFDYGRALLHGSNDLDALREKIESQWGKEALLALSLRAMSARNYPVLKRAMGHAKACQRVRIGKDEVIVNPVLKAA